MLHLHLDWKFHSRRWQYVLMGIKMDRLKKEIKYMNRNIGKVFG